MRELTSPSNTLTRRAYPCVQSEVEDLYVKSDGLYTVGLFSTPPSTTVLNRNWIDFSVPFDL